ncbi:HMG box family protein [Tritrichomonas foetus]|uniref:HMG box family protein n=1 Tax=Tritrichomonas foetus TaxID=1144522 RepID=A0A1J4JRH9_9EUKA|nr:HMG box family protein [Tritrichomonas foetus]|eukprot:OHT01635.1 HMG box family protein [Tritrichomonas foetus]
MFDQSQQWIAQQQQQVPDPSAAAAAMDMEDGDNSHRPPNAFILYSQAMRSKVRQDNPSLSNTEASRLLGKMWKEVPNEIKLQYKRKAAELQEEFKRAHPDYTYRKARRKRALNELLTKSGQNFGAMPYPNADYSAYMQMMGNQQQMQMPGQMQPGQYPMMNGMAGMQMPGQQMPQGMPGMQMQMPGQPAQGQQMYMPNQQYGQ